MLKWTRSLFATKRSVGCAVDGTKSVSWGLIFPKTTRAMDVLPDLREPMSTMRGARSARSLSPSLGVAGHLSRLAYMLLCGAAGLSAQGVARRRRAKLQRLRLDDRLPEACLRVRAVQKRLRSGAFWFWPCLDASMLQDAS